MKMLNVSVILLALLVAGCGETKQSGVTSGSTVVIDGRKGPDGRNQLVVKFPNGETQVIASETR